MSWGSIVLYGGDQLTAIAWWVPVGEKDSSHLGFDWREDLPICGEARGAPAF
jgi:hypothetical protein